MAKLWLAVALLTAVGAAVCILLYLKLSDPITQENCDKITAGMTEAKVEQILGRPTVTEDMRGHNVVIMIAPTEGRGARACRQKSESFWVGWSMTIVVRFVEDGDDTTVAYARVEEEGETLLQKMQRWLGLA